MIKITLRQYLNKTTIIIIFYFNFLMILLKQFCDLEYSMGIGDWGLGIGDWGLGIGPNPQSPNPNPQNPNPKNQYP